VNFIKYRQAMSQEERRIYKAAKQAEYRARNKNAERKGQLDGARQAVTDTLKIASGQQ